ncbi:MAG: chromosome segregation protein SMC [Finegoldia sp.]|nr:chromosome segregation protein SMC [Finegoldia sp.]
MGLKSIEIQGFKSFKNKVSLTFDNKITAIVGPNGSGKSNVSDAIVWVLGEQSAKKLRGTSMQDIIFSGTEKYKPVNFVQVDISFENDMWPDLEYNEVTVTRRAFRNGENEYYINKAPVRLKDIRNLFMDTGIGKDGYSVIGQGKIEEIVSSKSQDRRIVFEEAAGISKHKYNKDQSLKKLEKTNANLSRVEDILIQEDDRLKYLYRERQKAQRAIEISDRLRSLELDKAKQDIDNLEEKLEILVDKRLILIDDCDENDNLLSSNLEKLKDLKEEIKSLELKLNSYLEEKNNLVNQNVKDNAEISIINLRIDNNNKEVQRLNNDNEVLRSDLEIIRAKLEEIRVEKTSLEDKLSDIDIDDTRLISLSEELEELKSCYESFDNKIKEEKADLERLLILKNSFLAIEEQRTEIDKKNKLKLEENREYLSKISLKLDDFNKSLSEVNLKIESAEKRIEDSRKKFFLENQKLRENVNRYLSFQNDYNKAKNKYIFLKRLVNNHEDYNKTVQDFFRKLEGSDQEDKVIGTLGDLISIESRYHKAADAILGSAYNNIVVEDEYQAKDLINFLRINRIGRLTFLPISKIHPGKVSYVKDKMVIDHLNKLIKTDDRYRDIVDKLTANILVVENMDDAIEVSKTYKTHRIVSLEGDLINSWGSIVGGYKKNYNSSVLDRKSELEEAKRVLVSLTSDLNSLKNEIEDQKKSLSNRQDFIDQDLSEKNKLTNERDDLSRQIILCESQISVYERNIEDLEKKLSAKAKNSFSQRDSDRLEELDQKIKENSISLEDLKKKISKCEESLNLEKFDNFKLNSKYSSLSRDLNIAINQENDLIIKFENCKSNLETNIKTLHKLDGELKKMQASLRDFKRDNQNFDEKLSEKEEDIIRVQKEVSSKRELFDKLNDLVVDCKTKKERFISSIENIIKKSKETCLVINETKAKIFKQYNLNIDSYKKKTFYVDENEISTLKGKLLTIGSYSEDSIEEYNKVKEHNDLLKANKDELIKTRDDILKAISKLDREMKEIFTSKFNQINKEFQEVFSNLFNGGYAKLELTDDNVLNSGVEIIAQPPGKKLQNLNLLSGGEKSLTAIALLFAIFKTRPAPFCVLDEIDAALDEINIKRFKKYILEFSSEIQFIIITHRKSTMEIADILYGVNMEENGVSSIITLDVERKKLC